MKLDVIVQNEELNFKKCIESEMSISPKKMYIFAGNVKESGFNIIEENIIDSKVKLVMYMGVDKKNTTKSLLENILQYSKEVYYYNNNEIKEFEGSTIIFENDKRAVIYVSSAKLSENAMIEDLVMISKITYDLTIAEDKKEYKEKIKEFLALKELAFEELNKEKIQTLLNDKIIFSNKQYEHNVKSIAELLGKKDNNASTEKTKVKSDEDINAADFEIPVVQLKDNFADFDIDISLVEDISEQKKEEVKEVKIKKEVVKETVEEKINQFQDEVSQFEYEEDDDSNVDTDGIIDLDSMLLTKANVKLKEKKTKTVEEKVNNEESEFKESELVQVKKVDLNNVTNFIMQLPAKQQNKKDLDIIKVPNYIRDLIPAFFEFPDNAKTVEDNGVTIKERDIKIEILDCKNDKKYIENSSKMFQRKGQTFISILCKHLEDIEYNENDIVRIIKLSSDVYHIEIVTQDMQEYKIWSKIMNKSLKSCDRKYGIM